MTIWLDDSRKTTLLDDYKLPGFVVFKIERYEADPSAFVLWMKRRREKKRMCAVAATREPVRSMTRGGTSRAISRAAAEKFIWRSRCVA
jgi:hypothetical protein